MNILFYPTTLNLGYIIDACEIIKKKNKRIKFGFVNHKKGEKSKIERDNFEYLRKKKLNLSNFYLNDEIKFQNIDQSYLEYFEKISKVNIWKIISSDKTYGRIYINDIHSYRSVYSKKNSREILIKFTNIAKDIEKIFTKFKPNVVYISNGQSSLEASIINTFANYYNVKILVPEPSRFKNYFFFSPSIYIFNDAIKKYYFNKKNNKQDYNSNALFKEFIKKGLKSLNNYQNKNTIYLNQNNIIQKILGDSICVILKNIAFYFLFFLGIRIRQSNVLNNYNLLKNIKDEIFSKKILKYLTSIKCPDLKKKYVYFPLQLIPKTSTLLMGNDFMNQGFLVELISKNIPSDCKLYVKEHPAMLFSHSKKVEFYKRLKLLPNVELVPINIEGTKLIKNSDLVVVVDGSSGLEAILMGKPLVTMKYFIYSFDFLIVNGLLSINAGISLIVSPSINFFRLIPSISRLFFSPISSKIVGKISIFRTCCVILIPFCTL